MNKKNIIRNLICLEEGKASVLRFKEEKLEYWRRDGEKEFDITVDFWDWWKKVMSYVEGDPVDICFVYDRKYDLLEEGFILEKNIIHTEETVWKVGYIQEYFWKLKPIYFNLVIVGPEEQEYPLNTNKKEVAKRFETNLDFSAMKPKTKISFSKEDLGGENSDVVEEEYSEFAKYFVDLIRRERG